MATAGNAAVGSAPGGASENNAAGNVPQWKRDLIQRRRQQNKVLTNSGASSKLCAAVIASSSCPSSINTTTEPTEPTSLRAAPGEDDSGLVVASSNEGGAPAAIPSRGHACDSASGFGGTSDSSVARAMRLEADLLLCSDSEDVANGVAGTTNTGGVSSTNRSVEMERKAAMEQSEEQQIYENASEDASSSCPQARSIVQEQHSSSPSSALLANKTKRAAEKKTMEELSRARNDTAEADAESDSSEELQYGPGIVNKLKSKYLNLALRETKKSRMNVQRFRRAASLEDLLDREDEPQSEKPGRKYAKRTAAGTHAAGNAVDRYRNANRGSETMKRARSVETLVRYNNAASCSLNDQTNCSARNVVQALAPVLPSHVTTSASKCGKQEPINDHIVLIDRTSVKIESRLGELDKPKAANKPKRIKPVLAETERPPPDLVKTTMRIFEGSARKLKPKGEVAAKVATFKTINDTFKAQNQKKVLPKPPLQPKPFVNGNVTRGAPAATSNAAITSPKKIVLPQKSTAELIETNEEFHFDGVITEPIVQSVSSVVSKFQQIEKSSHSPSPSPEPTNYTKLRFSPAPSPEPATQSNNANRSKLGALEVAAKSPPLTPLLSPRIGSPGIQSPTSPAKDAGTTLQQIQVPMSPVKSSVAVAREVCASPTAAAAAAADAPKLAARARVEKETPKESSINKTTTRQRLPDRTQQRDCADSNGRSDLIEGATKDLLNASFGKEIAAATTEGQEVEGEGDRDEEDGPKTISSAALNNIGKAGTTMCFRFNDEPLKEKNYLPGTKQNGQVRKVADERATEAPPTATNETKNNAILPSAHDEEAASRLRERLEPQNDEIKAEDKKNDVDEIKSTECRAPKSTTTTTTYSQGNESKTIRCQKTSESPPQKQIGIIRPLVSTKTQHPQQNLSNRELEKNLINRVKSIEQPKKVVVSLKSADEIQPTKKSPANTGGGLWDTKPWNQQNNTMVFNFSNRKEVPDYIENDGLIIKRKREKPKVGEGGIIVLDATLDASTTDDAEWELSGRPPSPCDVCFLNDNVLINGRSNLVKTPKNHKHRIQFDDAATRTFEYPSEASMLEDDGINVESENFASASDEQSTHINNKMSVTGSTTSMPSLLGGGGLASYTPSKVDLTSEGFELGVTRAIATSCSNSNDQQQQKQQKKEELLANNDEVDYLKPTQDGGAWGSETTGDLLY